MDDKKEPLIVNGKHYPMWSQFIEKQGEWIGGELIELRDSFPPMGDGATTKITGINLVPNGGDSAWFEVVGEDFTCGADVQVLGVTRPQIQDGITFSGYGGHTWGIRKPQGGNE